MSTIDQLGRDLYALQERLNTARTEFLEAKAVIETEHQALLATMVRRHDKTMDFIDHQVAAIDAMLGADRPAEYKAAAE